MKSKPIIYFYCLPGGPPEAAKYQHAIICLAEGFNELGIEFNASCDYWLQSIIPDDYLFRCSKNVVAEDCDIIVIESSYIATCGIPKSICKKNRDYKTILLDNADGVRTLSHTKVCKYFDLVLRAHYNSKDVYYEPDKVKPWAFGLSNRILKELYDISEWSEREKKILVSFGCMHPLRRQVVRNVVPKLNDFFNVDDEADAELPLEEYHKLMWQQTGRRHYPSYYQRLKNIQACAAFGGLTPPAWEVESNIIKRYWRRRKEGYKNRIIVQWDSWRFWESLAAGAVTFHIDFNKYDLLLPVMPENMKHYIGVDLDDSDTAIDKIKEDHSLLEQVSIAEREWALTHYSPRAVADRFLDVVLGQ